MASISCPDEVLYFPNNISIEISYKNTQTYSKCTSYDVKAMSQGFVWHQIVVQHNGKVRGMDGSREILDAVFAVVEGEEFYPVAYRHGVREDRFLVRQCKPAFDKLFANNLRIQLSTGHFVPLQVQFNVADYKFGQISPTTQIAQALNTQCNSLECINGDDGILNLSRFNGHKDFFDLVVNLGNRAVFERVCETIFRNDEKFRAINGIVLSHNGIISLAPLKVFNGAEFSQLDLRGNKLRSPVRLCRDLKNIKAQKLYIADNPLLKTPNYPECLKPILNNFKLVDDIPSENLSKDYTPMDYEVDLGCDGYRVDWSNKSELSKFEKSEDWHAIMIPDTEQEFNKDEIFDYFFITVSPNFSDVYPCYYKFAAGEHQFLVRQCYDQLQYLVEHCNLEIKVPRICDTPRSPTCDMDISPLVRFDKTLIYYLRMNISPFKRGQIEPMECIERALDRRFSAMDRMLNLDNFQKIEGLENIVINLSSMKILSRILMQASRKFLNTCVELRLGQNKIVSANFPKVLTLMSNLKAIDLGNNWIQDLNGIKELQVLGLRSLRLDGNPLCSKYSFASEYVKAVRSYFTELTKLDNIEITMRGHLSSHKNYLCDVKCYDLVDQFVTRFFKTYESSERLGLKDLYHPKAVFTMTCSYMAAQVTSQNFRRISKYVEPARNIFKISDLKRAHSSMHIGTDEIMRVFMALPKVTHDMLTFSTDTIVSNEDMVVITVNGVHLDQAATMVETDMLMAFSRTFVLMPVARNLGYLKCATAYQIVNEQLSVFNPTQAQMKNAFKYSKTDSQSNKDELTVADKEALLIMLQEVTKLKSIWCTRCLEDAKWNFHEALQKFLELCESKEVPDSAFL